MWGWVGGGVEIPLNRSKAALFNLRLVRKLNFNLDSISVRLGNFELTYNFQGFMSTQTRNKRVVTTNVKLTSCY